MRIRTARHDDEAFIVDLCSRFAEFELPSWRTADEIARGTAAQMARALGRMDQRSTFLIAEDDEGTPLGFAWVILVSDFYTARDVAKISEIAVAQDGLGIGSLLMRASENWARERGCDKVVLNVIEGNERARAFYQRHGFAPEYEMLVKLID